MKQYIKKSNRLRIAAIVVGLFVSCIVLVQGVGQGSEGVASKDSSLDAVKNTIKKNKNLIVNSYLLGVSILQEASE